MIVVGYVYNNNGMASWAIEVAHALHEHGFEVMLVYAPGVCLPNSLPFTVLEYKANHKKGNTSLFFRKLNSLANMLTSKSDSLTLDISDHLLAKGVKVDCFILNQANFIHPELKFKQIVNCWTYPLTIKHYLTSTIKNINQLGLSAFISIVSAIGMYRKDLYAFKRADLVIAMTPLMYATLSKKQYKTLLASPCIEVAIPYEFKSINKEVTVLIAALDLESKRKNILWMLDVVNSIESGKIRVVLVGSYGAKIVETLKNSPHPVELKGKINRVELFNCYQQADLFLFSSKSDDWGYVLTEAMSFAVIPVAPRLHPFNYILNEEESLYDEDNKEECKAKIIELITNDSLRICLQKKMHERAKTQFSRSSFVKKITPFLN